jgi:hypothetical protein
MREAEPPAVRGLRLEAKTLRAQNSNSSKLKTQGSKQKIAECIAFILK